MLNTTVGQLFVNEALPPEMRDYSRVLDSKALKGLLKQVARERPDDYREISFKLNQIGQRSAQDQGGFSFGARHLQRSPVANEIRARLQAQLKPILEDDTLSDEQREQRIVRVVGKEMGPQIKNILAQADKDKNPLALQVLSGTRGKPMNLTSLLGSDLLYSDHRDEVIPIPVLRSYSEGMSPEEYWAGTYGARRGIIATKFATQEAGFLSKQLNQAGHRLVVEDEDDEKISASRGMVVDTDDEDNEGALLSRDTGPYKRNTPLTPKILKHLRRLGNKRILIRSPLVGGSPAGGVYARDVGIRETGSLPGRGEQVGLQAAQALSEPISQGQLSAKHSGGVAGQEKAVGGFQYINQLIQVPKKMQGGAAHAELDGKVQRIEEAPAGGHYVTVGDQQHFVGPGFNVAVKKGQNIEAGDLLSDGIPNPALIVQHKGVGEGRRYFVNEFRKAMASSGMRGHRRNIELLARGLINHVKLTEETDDNAPDDIVPYSTLEHTYKPRSDSSLLGPKKAVGQYLEKPVLHYTIGTKIRPSMVKDLEEFGVNELSVHKNPPPFEPHMVRGMYQLQHDPDWMTQMYGSGLKKSLLNSVARGATSESRGSSFVPSLAGESDFGEDPDRIVKQPEPNFGLPKLGMDAVQTPKLPNLKSINPNFGSLGSNLRGMNRSIHGKPPKPQNNAAAPPPQQPGPYGQPSATNPPPAANPPAATNPPPAANPPAATNPPPANNPPPATNPPADNNIMPERPGLPNARQDLVDNPIFNQAASGVFQQNPLLGMLGVTAAVSPDLASSITGGMANRLQGNQQNVDSLYDAAPDPAPKLPAPTPPAAPTPTPTPTPAPAPPVQQGPVSPQQPIESSIVPDSAINNEPILPSILGDPSITGNQVAPLGPNQTPRWLVTQAPAASKFVANKLMGQQAKEVGKRTLGQIAKHVATRSVPNFIAPGITAGVSGGGGAAGAFGIGAGGGAAGFAMGTALPAIGGFIGVNAITEGLDAAGLMPESWGGTGMGNMGWDQKGFEQRTRHQGFKDNFVDGVMNPLKSLGEIGKFQYEGVTGLGRDIGEATGLMNTQAENQTAQNIEGTQDLMAQRNEALQQQIDGINPGIMPEQQSQQQLAELQAQMDDNSARSEAMNDETQDWDLFNQHYLFSGGDYFNDNVSARGNQLSDVVNNLQSQDNLNQEDQFALDSAERRMNEYNRLSDMYGRVGSDFTEEDYSKQVRVGMQQSKMKAIELGKRLREPAVQANPALVSQYEAEIAHEQARQADYREFAENSKNQVVR